MTNIDEQQTEEWTNEEIEKEVAARLDDEIEEEIADHLDNLTTADLRVLYLEKLRDDRDGGEEGKFESELALMQEALIRVQRGAVEMQCDAADAHAF
jgi:hypothetical protein